LRADRFGVTAAIGHSAGQMAAFRPAVNIQNFLDLTHHSENFAVRVNIVQRRLSFLRYS
jgi:hypothetical protein